MPGAGVAAHADVVGEPEGVVAHPLGQPCELERAHLVRLELPEEEVAVVPREQAVRRHRQAHVHERPESILGHVSGIDARARDRGDAARRAAGLAKERLRRQIERCAASSALYRSKLEAAGAEPGDIRTLADLAQLPVVTKEELREDQRRRPPFGTFAVADPESFREVHPSTGTTGTPVNTIWSARDVETIASVTARTLWQFGVRPGDVIQNAFAYGLWVAGLSCHYAAARLGCLVVPTGTSTPTQRQIEFLQTVRSTVLLATPSYALHLAEGLAERGLDPAALPLRLGCFGGEPGAENPSTRGKLESGLGIGRALLCGALGRVPGRGERRRPR
jgi:hypothetical protein